MQHTNINSFTGLLKAAGQSNQAPLTTIEVGGVQVPLKEFNSDNYQYQNVNNRSSIYIKSDNGKTAMTAATFPQHMDKILAEWKEMLADQKPRPSKTDPDKAAKKEMAEQLLAEVVKITGQLTALGFKLSPSWKRKQWEVVALKKQKTAVQAAHLTEATSDQPVDLSKVPPAQPGDPEIQRAPKATEEGAVGETGGQQ